MSNGYFGKTNVTLSTPGAQSLTEETDFGGTIKKQWQANIGLRWSF